MSGDEHGADWSPEKDKDPIERLLGMFQKIVEKGNPFSVGGGCPSSAVVIGRHVDLSEVTIRPISNGYLVSYSELIEEKKGEGIVMPPELKRRELYAQTIVGIAEILRTVWKKEA